MAGRPRFDRDSVIAGALGAFWHKGYEATSMADLLEATGLSKSSLYSGFGDKHELFLAAYDRYREQQAGHLREVLDARPSPDGIRVFFEQIITGGLDPSQRLGCMTTNQAAERGAEDESVRTRVDEDYRLIEVAFAEHLRDGQVEGTVPAAADVDSAASVLVTAFSGFQLTVRADLDRARLHRALDYLLTPLTTTTTTTTTEH